MKKDFTYCDSETCIHRRGCMRWVWNYEDYKKTDVLMFLNPVDCMKSTPLPYQNMVRFRSSFGGGAVL